MSWRVLALAAVVVGMPLARAEETPAPERVVLHTTMGDLVCALDPTAAPGHVEQFLRLVRLGVYDTVPVAGVHPGNLIHVADAGERRLPLTRAQEEAIHPLKAEFNRTPYRRGTLLMGRAQNDPDSARTSFFILLRDNASLGQPYTAFGKVERGEAVLRAIDHVELGPDSRPVEPIEISRAEVLDTPEALRAMRLRGPRPQLRRIWALLPGWAWWMSGLSACAGLLVFAAGRCGRVAPRLGSVGLLAVLAGVWLWLPVLWSYGRAVPSASVAGFLTVLGVLRLMTRFEPPRTQAPTGSGERSGLPR